MAVNLIYRLNSDPEVPNGVITANGPLTMEQIDGNMKSLSNQFDKVQQQFDNVEVELAKKASISNPTFTGFIQIPTAPTNALPTDPVDGMLVYDTDKQSLTVYIDGVWQLVSTNLGLEGFVSKTGDIMSGKLTGTNAEFVTGITTLPPEAEEGSDLDRVTTVQWTKNTIENFLDSRLGTTDNEVVTDKITTEQVIVNGIANGEGLIVRQGDIVTEEGDIHTKNAFVEGTVTAAVLVGDIDLGEL